MIPLSLKTNTGRCAPLALQQGTDLSGIVIPDAEHAALAFSRPHLRERRCCSGDDEDVETAPQFTVEDGAPTPPAPVVVDFDISKLNLRTSSGRCAPLAFVPNDITATIPEGEVVEISYSRPPLRERGCCSGDDEDEAIRVIYTIIPTCMYIALEDGIGLFALEDEAGYIALECSN